MINGGKKFHDRPAIITGYLGWAAFADSVQKVLDLQGMVMGGGIDLSKGGSVMWDTPAMKVAPRSVYSLRNDWFNNSRA